MLGYSYWQKRFGGDPNVIGKGVLINGNDATIIGVGPKEFRRMFSPFEIDGYLPLGALAMDGPSPSIVRKSESWRSAEKPDVTVREAQNSLDVISARLAEQYPATDGGTRVRAIPERLARPQPYANNGFIIIAALFFAIAGLALLLACMNVTNVVLARALVRQREMALRAALGAVRNRLVRQMLTETVLPALLGGAGGLALAALASRSVPRSICPIFHYGSISISIGGSMRMPLQPQCSRGSLRTSVRLARFARDVNATLRDEGLSGGGKHRLHSDLVIAQIACSLMLLVMAGMFVSSLKHIEGTYLGFDPENVLNLTVDPSENGYDRARTMSFIANSKAAPRRYRRFSRRALPRACRLDRSPQGCRLLLAVSARQSEPATPLDLVQLRRFRLLRYDEGAARSRARFH